MNRTFFVTALFCVAAISPLRADQVVESIQQRLKDEGFYYGEINGKKDADTTAAIRRYQIRNGLQITGEINAETQRSLGITHITPSTSGPQPEKPSPEKPALRQEPTMPRPEPTPRLPFDDELNEDEHVHGPEAHELRPGPTGILDGTPFESAPPEVQRRLIIDAQTLLARRGYYRSAIDGVYGPGMQFAVRAYQERRDLLPTGRHDMETLASLGLLPGQRLPAFGPPYRRMFPPRSRIGPTGERIYIPN